MKRWHVLAALAVAAVAQAGVVGGPRGGRLLDNDAPRAEFLVTGERKVEVRFYDAALNPVPPGEQTVTVVAEAPAGRAKLELRKSGDALVSQEALPAGEGYLIVVRLKASPTATARNFRIPFHAEICAECQRAEYACTCEHGHDEGGHQH
jgi:hypothetical protein